ncbi:MAG: hypothetical protein RQ899_00515 [Pseudomonadales bacterium]|nr:hypothetical protein [Pseudomonadales bacterium]
MSTDLYRKTLYPPNLIGIDSTQGYLELSNWYENSGVRFHCNVNDVSHFGSMYFELIKLQDEGYLHLEWEEYENPEEEGMVLLSQIALTTSGKKLLDELQSISKMGRLKKRAIDLIWIICTSIITTLVVLWVKGE